MVHLDVVRTRNAALAQSQPLVAVFVGGTAGIGSYAARALAAHANGGKGLRLYIVGRNSAAADKITADCRAACPAGRFRFVPTDDLALLRNVDRVCAEILRLEQEASTTGERPRIDLLVMTHAYLALEARKGAHGRPHLRIWHL
jgi:NAD(P)-dependent dehydrogenase (short-subunit alcohol dehydrogenase family)